MSAPPRSKPKAGPAQTPVLMKELTKPRWRAGKCWTTIPAKQGYAADSPTPRKRRHSRSAANPREKPVTKVDADQPANPTARIFPVGKRSASQPEKMRKGV